MSTAVIGDDAPAHLACSKGMKNVSDYPVPPTVSFGILWTQMLCLKLWKICLLDEVDTDSRIGRYQFAEEFYGTKSCWSGV